MSTVTLSQPHCAMVSAEKPLGMASHALTQALPSLRRFFSMFDEFMTAFPLSSGSEDGAIISRWAVRGHGVLSQCGHCHPARGLPRANRSERPFSSSSPYDAGGGKVPRYARDDSGR